MEKKSKKQKKFRVWVRQVNSVCVDVDASSEDEAREKGYAKWRKEYAHSFVTCVEEQE